ncbi:DUF2913 family protein [Pectobacterium aroidearum]|uniref:DUF2913 family protein n=1 Tax=Pectobacterium aroidearum TaxID=1201031 RepID=UPI00301B2D15
MSQLNKAGDLAWCALVALALARQDGVVQSASQENLFLVRWLATAQKQRRFPRDVAPDIAWLLEQGRQYGVRARLPEKLDYLWRSCREDLSDQSDLFRLTYAFEMAKEAGWVYRLMADKEWAGRHAVKLNPAVNGIYALHSSIDNGFEGDGRARYPLQIRITGNVAGIRKLFESCGWGVTSPSGSSLRYDYLLLPKIASAG